jgi:hypothetical protein
MKPFRNAQHLLECHEAMFGEAGRHCRGLVLKHAETLFARPLDARSLRIVFAPVELGPYNKHSGYVHQAAGLILANRHICTWQGAELILRNEGKNWMRGIEDFLVHELTHVRQAQIIREQHIRVNRARGDHRDRGWYQAISEAAPKYLGVPVPESLWPAFKSVRVRQADGTTKVRKERLPGTLTEPPMCHWPDWLRGRVTQEGTLMEEEEYGEHFTETETTVAVLCSTSPLPSGSLDARARD